MSESAEHRISLVCPCFNEAQGIDIFYREVDHTIAALADFDWSLIFVDDGSTDATLEILNQIASRDDRVQVYSLSRNYGHQTALTAGLDVASGEAVIMLDTDMQHPPRIIPLLLAQWEEGFDIVSTVRKRTAGASAFKNITATGFYRVFNFLSDTKLVPGAADFCLLSRPVYTALRSMPERDRFLRGLIAWMGFSRTFVEFDAPDRAAGHSKYTMRRMIKLSAEAIVQFSSKPLRIATRLGASVAMIGFIYLVYILVRYLVYDDLVEGWASLISIVLILGGLQLSFTGILGAYLARIFEQVKQRPHYLFKQDARDTPLASNTGADRPVGRCR